ncbi:TadA family conjugal transfer-associated ATPase [Nocardioides sp. GY 10127]|uniref:TadA family conjugal transfer-associated ATPase n=1 Tax=Nocardioides sp. GY 10127 TaxID=2569762 RepID=UPI0010A82D83|nr:TadA family conjugal transfer-associated ATPase [Nocardioides sp. GY 10127]TIC78581.1 TadA family conjugal transfer-associated ATPase [Nocardioides sp. GY 10127]
MSRPAPAITADPGPVPGLDALVEQVRGRLVATPGALTPERVAAALREGGRPVGESTVLAVHAALRRDVVGAGPLEPLLRTPGVTDVLVNGAGEVHLDRGHGLELTDVRFPDEAAVRRLAQRLAASAGRRLDDAVPHCDLRLPDGTRFHAVLAPLARPGTLLSLRVPPGEPPRLSALVERGAMPEPVAALLRAVVLARVAFLVTGGTGAGKTTLLAGLLSEVPPGERLVLVEDASELRPAHPHVVALEARPANVEGAGAIDLRTLVRQALRMRPDRIVVGEVRGAEVVDLLAALNTGHEGGCGTLHANAPADVPARIEALALAAGLDREAVHSQLAAGLHVVLHVARDREGRRGLAAVGVVVPDGRGRVGVEPALTVTDGRLEEGPAAPLLARMVAP